MAALPAAVRVLDLASVLAGPFSGCQLAPPGAEVIRIEVPGNGERERTLAGDTPHTGKPSATAPACPPVA